MSDLNLPPFASFTKTFHNKPYAAIDPTQAALSASGKFVVVTGGGTSFGKATAIAFAQAGAKTVAILGRRLEVLEAAAIEITNASTTGTKVLVESVDLVKRGDLEKSVASLVKQGGIVDILVHTAALITTHGDLIGYESSELTRGLDNNVYGAFNTIQAFSPVLASDAKIFNISSGLAHMAPLRPLWVYTVTKAAIVKIFDFVQVEKPEWRVVNIQPGVVASEANASMNVESQDEPELAANFLVWLASPEGEFLKGKFVWANWDVDELKDRAEEVKKSLLLRVLLNGVEM